MLRADHLLDLRGRADFGMNDPRTRSRMIRGVLRYAIPGFTLIAVLVMLTAAVLQSNLLWIVINIGLVLYCIVWIGWERRRGPRE